MFAAAGPATVMGSTVAATTGARPRWGGGDSLTSVSNSKGGDVGGGAEGAANESVSVAADVVAEAAGVFAAAGPTTMMGSTVAVTTGARPTWGSLEVSEEDVLADVFECSGERVLLLVARHTGRDGDVIMLECTGPGRSLRAALRRDKEQQRPN